MSRFIRTVPADEVEKAREEAKQDYIHEIERAIQHGRLTPRQREFYEHLIEQA